MADIAATCERIAVQLAAELQHEILRRLRPRRRRKPIAVRPPPPQEQQPAVATYDPTRGCGHEDELGPPQDYLVFVGG